jgi:glycosyltransferase involved in cell wall biosynthesis
MKILHVVEAFGGGITEFINQLSNGLVEHSHIILYAQREIPIEEVKKRFAKNCVFVEWKHASRRLSIIKDLLAYKSLSRVISSVKPDIIHLHSSKAGFIGRVYGFFNSPFKKRIIYTPNGLYFIGKGLSKFQTFAFASLEYFAGICSGSIVAVSRSEAKALESIGLKANFINNGVLPWEQELTVTGKYEKFTIVTVGRISVQKNPLSFREIADAFIGNPNVQFIWVGEGEHMNLICDASNIKVTGWINANEVKEILLKSHLYLSTALWEGLPFAVLEAMNASLPLVISDCIGNVDLVGDAAQNGILFKGYLEAIRHITNFSQDPKLCLEMGTASREFLEESFNCINTVNSYDEYYRSLHKKYVNN